MSLKDKAVEIVDLMTWLYYRTRLYATGVKRLEFHTFGKYASVKDQVALMRAIVNGDFVEAEPLGDSRGLKPMPPKVKSDKR